MVAAIKVDKEWLEGFGAWNDAVNLAEENGTEAPAAPDAAYETFPEEKEMLDALFSGNFKASGSQVSLFVNDKEYQMEYATLINLAAEGVGNITGMDPEMLQQRITMLTKLVEMAIEHAPAFIESVTPIAKQLLESQLGIEIPENLMGTKEETPQVEANEASHIVTQNDTLQSIVNGAEFAQIRQSVQNQIHAIEVEKGIDIDESAIAQDVMVAAAAKDLNMTTADKLAAIKSDMAGMTVSLDMQEVANMTEALTPAFLDGVINAPEVNAVLSR